MICEAVVDRRCGLLCAKHSKVLPSCMRDSARLGFSSCCLYHLTSNLVGCAVVDMKL